MHVWTNAILNTRQAAQAIITKHFPTNAIATRGTLEMNANASATPTRANTEPAQTISTTQTLVMDTSAHATRDGQATTAKPKNHVLPSTIKHAALTDKSMVTS